MRKLMSLLMMIALCVACNKNANIDNNGLWPEPVVVNPATLVIDMKEGNSATFSTSEPSYISSIFLWGESLNIDESEILGWREEDNAILVWTCRDKETEVPYTHSSDWYDIEQIDDSNYKVTIGDISEERHISLYLESRTNPREPAEFDIIINPA